MAFSIANNLSLFQIDEELNCLIEQIQEEIAKAGEVSAESRSQFDRFLKVHRDKVDRIGHFLRSMDARALHCRAEAERLFDRARVSENKVLRTKAMVLYYLKSRNLERIEGIEFTLRIQSDSQDSVLIRDEEQLPLEYKRAHITINGATWAALLEAVPDDLKRELRGGVKEWSPDNQAIKQAAARKEEVSGAEVKRGDHLRVL